MSSSSRTTASPTPSSRPRISPSPMLRDGCGETGDVDTCALSTISARIRGVGLAGRGLEVRDQVAQRLGVGLGDVAGADRVGVGGRDLEVDRVRHDRGADLASDRVGARRRRPRSSATCVGQLARLGHDVGVGRRPAGSRTDRPGRPASVGLAGGHEQPGRRGVLRRGPPGDEGRRRRLSSQHATTTTRQRRRIVSQ